MAAHPNLVHLDEVDAREHAIGDLRAARKRLGAAAGAQEIGVSEWVLPAGARSTPPHVHADEEEFFYISAGGGLAWLDGTTYEVRAGDVLLHRCDAEAHTLIAGDEGLTFVAFAEGSRTSLTYLPRAKQFWAGKRWIPADAPHPFYADAELDPLDVPPPVAERPPTILRVEDVAPDVDERPGYRGGDRDLGKALGRRHAGLRHVTMQPGALSCPPHWHQQEEECFLVLDGDGEAWLDDERFALRPGSFLVRPPATGVAHALRAGDHGLAYLAFGQHRPSELVFYPRSGKVNMGGGILFRITPVDYWDGEPS